MRFMALLLLAALFGALVCAREYGPTPAPTRSSKSKVALAPIFIPLPLPVLSLLLLLLQVTTVPSSPHMSSLLHCSGN